MPFEQVVDHLNITRELHRNPVFQVMFTCQRGFNGIVEEFPLTLQGVQTDGVFLPSSVVKFDLALSAYEYEDNMNLSFEYATDLFEEGTRSRTLHDILKN